MANKETNLQNSILLDIGARQDVFVWRNQTGVFRSFDNPDRIIKVGNPGAPDILGVVMTTITPDMVGMQVGIAIGPEIKTGTGRQSDQQKKWEAAFTARAGVYRIIRSTAEMVKLISDVKAGKTLKQSATLNLHLDSE